MINSQKGDFEKTSLIKEGRKIDINEAIKWNEIINNSSK